MRRAWPILLLLLVLVAAFASASPAFGAAKATNRAYVILAPALSWADITPTATPTLWRLAGQGAVGDLNAMLRAREGAEAASAQEGALDLSAGNWAAPEFFAFAPANVGETVEGGSAALAYVRRMGTSPGVNAIAYPGLPPAQRKSAVSADDVVIGTLGQAVEATGGTTIAIGNSDSGDAIIGFKLERPAGLAAMDMNGLVRLGDVSPDLLMSSAGAPYGLRTSLAEFGSALRAAEASAALLGGPALVVLDPGDGYRAQRFAWQAADDVAVRQRQAALSELDAVVALALSRARADDIVMVAGQAPLAPPAAGLPGFSPLLVSGAGLKGYLSSGSTHRTGVVSNPDLTAQVMKSLGLERPVQVIGNPLTASAAPDSAAERIAHLSALDSTAIAQNVVRGPFALIFAWLFVAVVLAAGAVLALRTRMPQPWLARASAAVRFVALVPPALALSGWLMFVVTPNVGSPTEMWLVLLAVSVMVVAAAALVWRYVSGRMALAGLFLAIVAVLVVDQLLGAPLSRTNLIGYSPLDSARYYGIGNEAAALLLGSALVGLALLRDGLRTTRARSMVVNVALPAIGALVVVVCAAPFFGANVGVAIWGTAGFAIAWTLMSGRRITWRTALVAVLVVVVLIGGFAALDAMRGGSQTHLARSLTAAQEGGVAQLGLIVQRKAETNLRVLAQSNWSIMLVATLAFLLFLRVLPGRPLSHLLAENPALRAVLWAATVSGVLAFLTEDTGIDVPSWIWFPVGIVVVWLAVATVIDTRRRSA